MLIAGQGNGIVKIVTGRRRFGKSLIYPIVNLHLKV